MSESRKSYLIDFLVMSVVTGAIASLFSYGYGNEEQLPKIFRELNPAYLSNDFYVNASDWFGPRFYYVKLMALLSKVAPLPVVFFVLLFAANSLMAFVTCLFARYLFAGSTFAGLVSCAAVMSVKTFYLGYKPTIASVALIPSVLIMPLVMMSVYAAFRNRPVLSALAAAAAAPIHPLWGLETGGIMFATWLLTNVAGRDGSLVSRIRPGRALAALLILLASTVLWVLPHRGAEQIPTSQFIEILTFRAPHHYLPSTFPKSHYLWGGFFVLAFGIAWYRWRRIADPSLPARRAIPILLAILFVTSLAGYVFVELIPTRIMTVAQTFRLLNLFKWLGLIVIAGAVAHEIQNSRSEGQGAVLLLGLLTTPTMAFTQVWRQARDWAHPRAPWLATYTGYVPILLLLVLLLLNFRPPLKSAILLALFLIVALPRLYDRRRQFFTGAGLALVLFAGATYWANNFEGGPGSSAASLFRGRFTLRGPFTGYEAAGDWARHKTPADAVFLTPPNAKWFRVIAERSVIADSCIPFPEPAMVEWYERLRVCFGIPKRKGAAAFAEMDRSYKRIDDAKLGALRAQYGATHALLYNETETALPVIHTNGAYKIVTIE